MTIPSTDAYFDMIFEATRGKDDRSNIALDDVYYLPGGSCEYFNGTSTSPQPSTAAPVVKFDCNFEKDFCAWTQDPNSPTSWIRKNGKTAKFGTAPLNDVTFQNSLGYYAYSDSYSDITLPPAILKSPVIEDYEDTCLEFWYQLGGSSISSLSVVLKQSDNETKLWSRFGNSADSWSHAYLGIAELPIAPVRDTSDRWLEFRGKLNNSNYFP